MLSKCIKQCQENKKHSHYNRPLSYLKAHICIQTNDTHTHYVNPYTKEIYSSLNEIVR